MKKCLVALAFGTLGLGMSEFGMMGILTFVASGLHVSIPQAGHLVSAYALGVCVGAPLTVAVAHTRPLKQILLALAGLMVAGNLCAAFAPNYGVLLAMRFVSGLPHGAYFGVGSIVAARVAGPGRSAQAVAVMIAGMTVANLFGVPLGTLVSHLLSWRALFCIAGVWGAVPAFFLWRWVPWMESVADSRGLKGQFAFLRNRAPWLIILATMFGNGGIFCMYSYVSPLMIRVAGFSPEAMTLVILLAGLGMFVGNLVSGGLSDRYTPERVARFAQGIAVVALALILFLAANRWAALTLTVVCTTMLFAVSSPQQVLILENAPGGQMLGAALIQVAFNLGNALGAYCGGLPIEYGLGYEYSALPGVGFALLGFVMLTLFVRRYGRRRPQTA